MPFANRLSILAIAATLLVSVPAVASAETENGGSGGEREGGRGVPGPVEGVGFPFIMAGGAVALALAARNRRGS